MPTVGALSAEALKELLKSIARAPPATSEAVPPGIVSGAARRLAASAPDEPTAAAPTAQISSAYQQAVGPKIAEALAAAVASGTDRPLAFIGKQLLEMAATETPLDAAALSPPMLRIHIYDHCPFCSRVILALGRLGTPYEKVLHGYGRGADPSECEGRGYDVGMGPAAFGGKKELPVLEGAGVPAPPGMTGLPESMDIISYLKAPIAPAAADREELAAWKKRLFPNIPRLVRPRLFKMPVADWADPRDVEYGIWKFSKGPTPDLAAAEAATEEFAGNVSALLLELEPMLLGEDGGAPTLNASFSMDDITLLPLLRNLTSCKAIVWPPKAKAYVMSVESYGVKTYFEHAF